MGYFRKYEFQNKELTGTVYVTDERERALELKQAGEAVIIWLHEENRGEDFFGFPYAVESVEDLDEQYLERVYRRFQGLPWRILETERLLVRESVPEDAAEFVRIYEDAEAARFLADCKETVEEEQEYLRQYAENMYGFYEYGIWTVLEKASGRIVGRAGLSMWEESEVPELGFVIAKEKRGQGLALEVCGAIVKYAFEELYLDELAVVAETENPASLALCRKLGFREDGELVRDGKRCLRFVTNDPTCRREH